MSANRFADRPGLVRLAGLLEELAGALATALRSVNDSETVLSGSRLGLDELLDAVGDIRLRRLPAIDLSATGIPPPPIEMRGIAGSSEVWGFSQAAEARLVTAIENWAWVGSAALQEAGIHGPAGTLHTEAVSAAAHGEAWIGFDDWGLELGGVAAGGAYLVRAEAGAVLGPVAAGGEVFVGGELSTEADLDLQPQDGDIGLEGGISAFAGIAVSAAATAGSNNASATVGGELGIGIGADVDASLVFEGGSLSFDLGASAFLGAGGGFDVAVELNLPELARDAIDTVAVVADWVTSLWP